MKDHTGVPTWCHLVVAAAVAATPLVAGAQATVATTVASADSAVLAGMRPIPLHNGLTPADLTGRAGDAGVVLVARRENVSAHGRSAIAFAVHTRATTTGGAHWQLITVPADTGTTEEDATGTEEGADCTLRDVRLLRPHAGRGPATLVIAQRAFGASYADSAAVRFMIYRLQHDADDRRDYFARTRVLTARRRYCDVNDAFARELGLSPSAGVVHDVR